MQPDQAWTAPLPSPCQYAHAEGIEPGSFFVQALSNAHTFLFEERELLLELQAENEALHQHLRTGSSKAAQPVTTLHSHVSRPKVPG